MSRRNQIQASRLSVELHMDTINSPSNDTWPHTWHILNREAHCCMVLAFLFGGCSPGGSDSKETVAMQNTQVQFLGQGDPLRSKWLPNPVFLPGEFHWQRNGSYSPWVCKESESTEWLTLSLSFHVSMQCLQDWHWLLSLQSQERQNRYSTAQGLKHTKQSH